jgi:hypothetical protein
VAATPTVPAATSSGGAAAVVPAAWWQLTGDPTEDACYLVERWLARELELIQVPLDVITLAAEQVQDVRLALLEGAGEASWPAVLVSAFLGFLTNSPYGGQLIQLFTTRVLRSVLNSSAILQASQSYSRGATVEFFRYAGQLYRYVPARGTAAPSSISTRQIAELYESLKSLLAQGVGYAAEVGEAALSDQQRITDIAQGLSQSAVTLGQGAVASGPAAVAAEDTPGVTILDECMTRAAAHRNLTRATAAALIAQVRAGRVSGAEVAAQIPGPLEQDLTQYRRRARLQAEALLWVQLVPVTPTFRPGQVFAGRVRLDTEASERLIEYWRDRFAPLIATSPSLGATWRAAVAQYQRDSAAYDAATFPATFEPGIYLRRSREALNNLILRYLRDLRENLQTEIATLQAPPGATVPRATRP